MNATPKHETPEPQQGHAFSAEKLSTFELVLLAGALWGLSIFMFCRSKNDSE
jgi:hypothetical protein